MSNLKPLTRYSNDPVTLLHLGNREEASEGLVCVSQLRERLHTMKANACDPAETDTLNTLIKLLEG